MFNALTTSFTVAEIMCASTVLGRHARAQITLLGGEIALTERSVR